MSSITSSSNLPMPTIIIKLPPAGLWAGRRFTCTEVDENFWVARFEGADDEPRVDIGSFSLEPGVLLSIDDGHEKQRINEEKICWANPPSAGEKPARFPETPDVV